MVSKFAQPFVALCFLYLFGQPAAQAVDAISFELLSGNKSQVQNIGLQWTWQNKWFETTGAHLGGYWNATFARWRNSRHHGIPGNIQSLNDIGLAASFRYQRNDHTGLFVEAATGPHLLSEYYDNDNRRQGSRLVFESGIGIGVTWPAGVEAELRLMHLSNGRLKQPNDAVNMVGMGVRYWW